MLFAGEQLAASDSYPEPLLAGARAHSRQDVKHFAKVALVAKAHELADVGDGRTIHGEAPHSKALRAAIFIEAGSKTRWPRHPARELLRD
jgi:hypothetical protein